ncbi:hypothetical protein GCM10009550_79390 [Actinocorallia libanotica]|uniref:Uncharacterized protein n=1 Tax=Actinocorallia libanotica TaxID=46162 RepID=A0ABN1S2V4_9ACTN
MEPGVEVFAAVAGIEGYKADLGPVVEPPDAELEDGAEGRPALGVVGQVEAVYEAADREAEVYPDPGGSRLWNPDDRPGKVSAEP